MPDRELKHHCGLFGVFGHSDSASLTRLGLFAQQHRGQESAGMCTTDGGPMKRFAATGLVHEVLTNDRVAQLRNPIAIGHVRYSTTGSCNEANAQPMLFSYIDGQAAIAHNGNIINAAEHRAHYEEQGHIFQSSSDTEIIMHLLSEPRHLRKPNPLVHVLDHLQGAYCLLILMQDRLMAVRDPKGFRPLCLGRLKNGAYVVASESCALDLVEADYERDIDPGEIVTITEEGLESQRFGGACDRSTAQCVFEHVYFADPSSNVFGQNVHQTRLAMGRQLAVEAPAEGDMVIPVPNCARCAAIGYSQQSGIPLGRGFTTSHYAGRSFIMPEQHLRDLAVKLKLNVIGAAVQGKRLVVVEDSVVRGTTTRGKMGALRKAGAKEIHLRVASPPIRHGCYYGIDFPDQSRLVATQRSVEEIRAYLQIDSLAYISLEGMLSCVQGGASRYCNACFSGRYPVPIDKRMNKYALEASQLKLFDAVE